MSSTARECVVKLFFLKNKMSCCPSIKCRNTGSGYVKSASTTATETNKKLDDILAARAQQDSLYFPPLHTSVSISTLNATTASAPAPLILPHLNMK